MPSDHDSRLSADAPTPPPETTLPEKTPIEQFREWLRPQSVDKENLGARFLLGLAEMSKDDAQNVKYVQRFLSHNPEPGKKKLHLVDYEKTLLRRLVLTPVEEADSNKITRRMAIRKGIALTGLVLAAGETANAVHESGLANAHEREASDAMHAQDALIEENTALEQARLQRPNNPDDAAKAARIGQNEQKLPKLKEQAAAEYAYTLAHAGYEDQDMEWAGVGAAIALAGLLSYGSAALDEKAIMPGITLNAAMASISTQLTQGLAREAARILEKETSPAR